jgi:hypothetical protein
MKVKQFCLPANRMPKEVSEEESSPSGHPAEVRRQVVYLARSGTRVAQLSETFGMTEATIYNWINQEIDRGEVAGESTEQSLKLKAAKRRIRQLATELAPHGQCDAETRRQPPRSDDLKIASEWPFGQVRAIGAADHVGVASDCGGDKVDVLGGISETRKASSGTGIATTVERDYPETGPALPQRGGGQ